MSIVEQAKAELERINFGAEDTAAMVDILQRFFKQWDSGGAVWVAQPVLLRCISGLPLEPLTGADDEWMQPDPNVDILQNIRYGSVFKYPDGRVLDIRTDREVTFPYLPDDHLVQVPLYVMDVSDGT